MYEGRDGLTRAWNRLRDFLTISLRNYYYDVQAAISDLLIGPRQ